MFDPIKPQALADLMLTAKHLVQGLYAGRHVAARQGEGGEFYDFRPYTPGDDPAQIDWKRFARSDRFYLRRYEHETDLAARLCLDISPSMDFANPPGPHKTAGITKLAYAVQLAAALGTLLIRQGDRVGLRTFASKVAADLPITGTEAHLKRVVGSLAEAKVGQGAANFREAMRPGGGRCGLMIVLSDFLDEPGKLYESLAAARGAGSDVMLMQVLTDAEIDLTGMPKGRATLVDPEADATTTNVARSDTAYRRAMAEHIQSLARTAGAHGIEHYVITTSEPALGTLRRVLASRGSRFWRRG